MTCKHALVAAILFGTACASGPHPSGTAVTPNKEHPMRNRDAAPDLAGLHAGMSADDARRQVLAWGVQVLDGTDGQAATEGGPTRSVLKLAAGTTPFGPVSGGWLLFLNHRLARVHLDSPADGIAQRLGPADLARGGERVWWFAGPRIVVRSGLDEDDTPIVEALFHAVAIAEGEISEAYWQRQQQEFDEAVAAGDKR